MHAWESIQFGVGRAQAAEAFSQEWAVSSSSSWFLAAIISCSSGGRIKDAIVSFVTTTLPLGLSFICCNGSGEKRSAIQFSTKMTITKDDVYRAIIKKKKKNRAVRRTPQLSCSSLSRSLLPCSEVSCFQQCLFKNAPFRNVPFNSVLFVHVLFGNRLFNNICHPFSLTRLYESDKQNILNIAELASLNVQRKRWKKTT